MIPQYEPVITENDIESVTGYMKSGGWLTEHKVTERFERELSFLLGFPFVSCVNNGTIAISLALLAAGIKPGDKVFVPDLTMVATATAVELIGAIPVFVDVQADTLCLDSEIALDMLDILHPKAIIYVSLNGRWDISEGEETLILFEKCRERGIAVIEDAAQSFGSQNRWGLIGRQADFTTLSFSPHKIITTGQGGAIITWDEKRYEQIERLKDFGRLSGGEDVHETFGINSKFTDLQASIGLSQLERVRDMLDKKKSIYLLYQEQLSKIPEIKMLNNHYGTPWFVDIYTDLRDQLEIYLKENATGTRRMYPALHTQPCFAKNTYPHNNCSVAEWYAKRGLWLPSSLNLDSDKIRLICKRIEKFFDDFRRAT